MYHQDPKKWLTILYLFCLIFSVADSLELIDQDYVLVSGPPIEVSSSSASISKPSHIPYKSNSPPRTSIASNTTSTAPMTIIGSTNSNICCIGSLESQSSAPGTSLGSMDIGDAFEQPSTHGMTRIKSLQKYASSITELRGKVSYGLPVRATNQFVQGLLNKQMSCRVESGLCNRE